MLKKLIKKTTVTKKLVLLSVFKEQNIIHTEGYTAKTFINRKRFVFCLYLKVDSELGNLHGETPFQTHDSIIIINEIDEEINAIV